MQDRIWNTTIARDYAAYEDHLESIGFDYIDSGGSRHVYHRGNVVIKVPNSGFGIIDNVIESIAWKKYKNNKTEKGIYLAPCRLLRNQCLMMVYVEIDSSDWSLPRWAVKVDGEQVGVYKKRHVAYDYAHDVDVPDFIALNFEEYVVPPGR